MRRTIVHDNRVLGCGTQFGADIVEVDFAPSVVPRHLQLSGRVSISGFVAPIESKRRCASYGKSCGAMAAH